MRFRVTHEGETVGRRETIEAALELGHTMGAFVVVDNADDLEGDVRAPWRAASCDGESLIVNHPGGGQSITLLGAN